MWSWSYLAAGGLAGIGGGGLAEKERKEQSMETEKLPASSPSNRDSRETEYSKHNSDHDYIITRSTQVHVASCRERYETL